ncbi:hypothetical protein F5B21DRAFT_520378 [Xylaria acuta]|nr:hypothetical protein F5B21DRAFT_520378 [Xylaria acuta]
MKFFIPVVAVICLATVGTTHPIDYTCSIVTTNVSVPSGAAVTANHTRQYERAPTEVQNETELEVMKDLASGLANAVTTTFTDNQRTMTTVAEDGHRGFDAAKVVWIVLGSVVAILIIIAAAGAILDCGVATARVCILCINWEKLWARRPTKTSKGVRQLELGHLSTQCQSADLTIKDDDDTSMLNPTDDPFPADSDLCAS